MSRSAGVVALAAMALSVAACSGEIMRNEVSRPGVPTVFAYAAAKGEMKAEVVGNPFSLPQQAVDAAVLGIVERNHNGPATRFSTTPGPNAAESFRIVVVFNPPEKGAADAGACSAPATMGATGPKLGMVMALCGNDTLYAWTHSTMPAPKAPDDPAFEQMVARAARALIPTRDPYVDSDRNNCRFTSCS